MLTSFFLSIFKKQLFYLRVTIKSFICFIHSTYIDGITFADQDHYKEFHATIICVTLPFTDVAFTIICFGSHNSGLILFYYKIQYHNSQMFLC